MHSSDQPKIESITYTSGIPSGSYQKMVLSLVSGDFPKYPSLEQICNSNLICMQIIQKIKMIDEKYQNACDCFYSFKNNPNLFAYPVDIPRISGQDLFYGVAPIYRYHFLVEEMIAHMRTVLDSLVQLGYLLSNYEKVKESKKIKIDKIGDFTTSTNKNPNSILDKIIIGDNVTYESDPNPVNFLIIINELSNSIKHSMLRSEALSIVGQYIPTIYTYASTYNNYKNKIRIHNHELEQIVLGFQITVKRIITNQKIYESSQLTN